MSASLVADDKMNNDALIPGYCDKKSVTCVWRDDIIVHYNWKTTTALL